MARFNKPANYHPRWDLNADGVINNVDLNVLGQSRPPMFNGAKALFKACPVDRGGCSPFRLAGESRA